MIRIATDLVCRSLLCFGIAAAVGGLVREPPRDVQAGEPELSAAVFGIYDELSDFTATEVVPLRVGQEFGWRLALDDDGLHRWREVLITPEAPREWIGSDLTISGCGRVGVTDRTEVAHGGLLEHTWTVTEGDPAGPHEIHLYLDDELVNVFRFSVQPE